MKHHKLLGGVAILVSALCALAFVRMRSERRFGLTPQEMLVGEFKMLADAVESASFSKETHLLRDINTKTNITCSNLFNLLRQQGVAFRNELNPDSVVENRFEDFWGHEVKFTAERVDGRVSLMIQSFGPNGLDENGKGDDIAIVRMFDL